MKKIKLFLWILITLTSCQVRSQHESVNASITAKLDELAKSVGYEFVYGDKFPLNNPYGSFGAPCLFNILLNNESDNVLFLCRKPNEFYQKKNKKI